MENEPRAFLYTRTNPRLKLSPYCVIVTFAMGLTNIRVHHMKSPVQHLRHPSAVPPPGASPNASLTSRPFHPRFQKYRTDTTPSAPANISTPNFGELETRVSAPTPSFSRLQAARKQNMNPRRIPTSLNLNELSCLRFNPDPKPL